MSLNGMKITAEIKDSFEKVSLGYVFYLAEENSINITTKFNIVGDDS